MFLCAVAAATGLSASAFGQSGTLLDADQVDRFPVTLQELLSYEWRVKSGNATELEIALYEPDGDEVFPANGSPHFTVLANQSGRFELAVRGDGASYPLHYEIQALLSDFRRESDASAITGEPVLPDVLEPGRIDTVYDEDWHPFEARAGYHVGFGVFGRDDGLGSVRSVNYEIKSPQGLPQQPGLISEDGVHFVNVYNNTDEVGTYTIIRSPMDDYPADESTEVRIRPGFRMTGGFQTPGDTDAFKIHLDSRPGVYYRFSFADASENPDPDFQFSFSIQDLNGPWHLTGSAVPGRLLGIEYNEEGEHLFTVTAEGGFRREPPEFYSIMVERISFPLVPTINPIRAAALPSSRAVGIGEDASFFAVLLNPNSSTGVDCGIAPRDGVHALFSFYRTDPLTNAVIGGRNEGTNISPGGSATFLVNYRANGVVAPTNIEFDFKCANSEPAPVLAGVNTFELRADVEPGPDPVLLAATASADGVVRLTSLVQSGAFLVASANVGAAGPVRFTPEAIGDFGAVASICETDPSTGSCLERASSSVEIEMAAGETVSLAVFVRSTTGAIPFSPANRRVSVVAEAADEVDVVLGRTSVAVTTSP